MKTKEQICELQNLTHIPFEWWNPDGTKRNLEKEILTLKIKLEK
jgi:hypothetical protein